MGVYIPKSNLPCFEPEFALVLSLRTSSRPFLSQDDCHGGNRPLQAIPKKGGVLTMATVTQQKQSTKSTNGKVLEVPATITVRELAGMMGISPIDIIKELMSNGIMANINQHIDFDTVSIIGEEMGFEIVPPTLPEPEVEEQTLEVPRHRRLIAQEDPKLLKGRPPVVTVLGHVDHGKTTLLDTIRKTEVADGEAGGITQHIGAYQVHVGDQRITFLDTPGHAAFTAMRARGAQVTDLAILVVAADDGVMPQTREAIDHAQAAQVPILVAMNKIDKENANPVKVQQQLADAGLMPEEWGGETPCVPISAKEKMGIDDLLENVLLITEVADLKANPNRSAQGVVIEGRRDKRQGVLVTLLVQNGALKQGDILVTGTQYCRIRAMFNDRGKRIKKAGLSAPVSVLGFSDVPSSGDFFEVVKNEKVAKTIIAERQNEQRTLARANQVATPMSLEDVFKKHNETGDQTLNLILKADVQGSLEPIVSSLKTLEDGVLKIRILSQGTGNISESDINLAVASEAIVLGFNVEIDSASQRLADASGVDVRRYKIIYKLIDDVELALKGLLEPVYEDRLIGQAQVKAVFKIPRQKKIAGSIVLDGKVTRDALIKVMRQQAHLHTGNISSLKRFTEDVPEVTIGYECGIGVDGFDNFKEGDTLEVYIKERVN